MPRRPWMALVVSGLVAGCAARPERYGFDSATSACRQNPAVCARMAGEEAVLPGTRAMRVAGSIGTAGDAALRLLKAEGIHPGTHTRGSTPLGTPLPLLSN